MRIKADVEFVKKECENDECDWNPDMAEYCGKEFAAYSVDDDGDYRCVFADGVPWYFPLSCIETEPAYKSILFALCASLTLCDHLGDVCEDVFEALDQAGIKVDQVEEFSDIIPLLPQPAVTLHGSTFDEET